MDSHTLIQALIYLGSAALIVPIAVRLGLGSVLGYLIAGCIIGPWGLRLVTDAESILHFAEIGVVLMLFIIGLELDPQRLWKLRAAVFGGGALQMVICGGLLGLFCMLLGLRWQVAELIGMTLALSSTAIAMQAMNERNLMVTQMGRSAFAVLLFQDIAAIPLDDKKSFDMLQRSETTAVFQLESRGMKDLIKRLQPDCFEDMIALVALFRPGPLQSGMVDNFIDRKHGREEISYPDVQWQHESLKPVLEPTYGIILYQEQVMQIAQVLSGYTLGGADMLRRAMGKKKPEEMAKQRSVFAEGAEKNGINAELAMKIFDLVEKFAGYGFNKSHSAAYALVSYQTLWLKAHYPAEFMAAVMTADMDNTEKVVGLVDECWRMGLKILPPDINSGLYHFHVNDDGEIVYGIGAIKGVGEGPIEAIIEARNKGGYFRELFDLCARTDTKKLNRRVLEKLIMSGAFDRLGPHRAALMNSLGDALKAADQHAKAEAIGQADMFGVLAEEPEQIEQSYASCQPWPEQVVLDGERETLGLYLTGHPINQYLKEIERYVGGVRLKDMHPTERGKVTTAAGLVVAARVMVTKRGNRIGICTLDDRSGRLEVMLFTDALDKYQQLLEKDRILIVSGQVSFDDFSGGLKMTAREVMDIDEAREKYARGLAISLTDRQIDDQLLNRLRQSLEPHRSGTIPVHLYYQRADARARLRFGATWRVSPSDRLLNDLRGLIGSEQVELEFD